MPKKQTKKLDRSQLVKGPLTTEQYREIVHLPIAKGILPAPKPERPNGHWEGDTWVQDKPPSNLSVVAMLMNYNHLGNDRGKLLRLVANGQVTEAEWAEAQSRWLFPGRLDRQAIEREALAVVKGETPEGVKLGSVSERTYQSLDSQERAQTYGITDTKSDYVIRKRRLQRLRGLF